MPDRVAVWFVVLVISASVEMSALMTLDSMKMLAPRTWPPLLLSIREPETSVIVKVELASTWPARSSVPPTIRMLLPAGRTLSMPSFRVPSATWVVPE